ncbi:MAG: hypothetical protein BWY82_00739 [Verrucomicrobia bacterium ADurb.Bin474]|nr:MAG: hypothetical protein BWY82_00739 [Verrucomicrobia bacterium ADurb.Bin474]
METLPRIRRHEEFESDIAGQSFIDNSTLFKWYTEDHSVSKHLLTMYSIVRGMNAKRILEIGFGRSSKVFARAAHENGGVFTCCDRSAFSYLFSREEQEVTHFVHGNSDKVWDSIREEKDLYDFAFLDHFSGEGISYRFCLREIITCMRKMKPGGIICIHDVSDKRYPLHHLAHKLERHPSINALILPYQQGLAILQKSGQRILHHSMEDYGIILKSGIQHRLLKH